MLSSGNLYAWDNGQRFEGVGGRQHAASVRHAIHDDECTSTSTINQHDTEGTLNLSSPQQRTSCRGALHTLPTK